MSFLSAASWRALEIEGVRPDVEEDSLVARIIDKLKQDAAPSVDRKAPLILQFAMQPLRRQPLRRQDANSPIRPARSLRRFRPARRAGLSEDGGLATLITFRRRASSTSWKRLVSEAEGLSRSAARLRRRAHSPSKDGRLSTPFGRVLDSPSAPEVFASMRSAARWVGRLVTASHGRSPSTALKRGSPPPLRRGGSLRSLAVVGIVRWRAAVCCAKSLRAILPCAAGEGNRAQRGGGGRSQRVGGAPASTFAVAARTIASTTSSTARMTSLAGMRTTETPCALNHASRRRSRCGRSPMS